METFLAAIKARFIAASGLSAAITGGLHINIAPPSTAMPYAIFTPIVSPTTQVYGAGAGFTEPQGQFVIRAVGSDAALLLCEQLAAAYRNQTLTISGGKMLNNVQTSDPIPEPGDPGQDEQGRDTFGWIVSFRFSIA